MPIPPDETLNAKAGNCIWNVEGIICAKLSARIIQLTIHHNQNRDTDSRCDGRTQRATTQESDNIIQLSKLIDIIYSIYYLVDMLVADDQSVLQWNKS